MQTTLQKNQKLFTLFFIAASLAALIITGIRSALVPFNHDETATFFYYIQTGEFLPFRSHVDANNHILNSALGHISFMLFGDSPFALRLPNLAVLLVLIFAVWRVSKELSHTLSRLVLAGLFLLSFHWLSFYSACRGYGLSMSFLLLSLSYFHSYFKQNGLKQLILFYLFIQLAISANLILIIVALLLTSIIISYQLFHKIFLKKWNFLVLVPHLFLLFCWIYFSLFLQKSNALYYGEGDSYWQVTFVSLIELITGTAHPAALYIFLFVFLALISASVILILSKMKGGSALERNTGLFFTTSSLLYSTILVILICAFYLMNLLFGINYPEDRTGLFFYLFFVLALVFTLDLLPPKILVFIALPLITAIIVHFTLSINFRKHSLSVYETIPARFYHRLVAEQKLKTEKITIGAHRLREFFYAFLNYRHGGKLNLADPPETMHANSDYYIGHKRDKRFYDKYYEELDVDKDWHFTLLKRRKPLERHLIIDIDTLSGMNGNNEFYNFYASGDTSFNNQNPLLIEFNLIVEQAPRPFKSWLVVQVDSPGGENIYYKRIPLNWLKYNWNNQQETYHLVTGPLPQTDYKITCYLWNRDKHFFKLKVNPLRIYRLKESKK